MQSFQPDLFTGRATTSIPIAVPPGRKGMQPALALAYSSSGRNGWLGVGWSLELGAIERSTKAGVPKFDATDAYTLQFQGVASDLVKIPDGTYRLKDEGLFLRIEYTGASGWEVRDRAGTRYLFGQTAASQTAAAGQVARWHLDKAVDVHGNSLAITYTQDQGQCYPLRITYTGHESGLPAPANQVDFTLGSRTDIETSYRFGFPVTTAKLLTAVAASVVSGQTMQLARRYDLTYTASARSSRSLLTSVKQIGTDGTTSVPPTSLNYSQDPPTYLHCHNCVPGMTSGSKNWQLQVHVGNLFPADEAGDTQRLWPGGDWEPGVISWTEKVCRKRKVGKSCNDEPRSAVIPRVPWGTPQLEPTGSSSGVSWTTDANGNLAVSGPRESHVLAMTWLYSPTATSVSVSSLSVSGHADVFYVPAGGSSWTVASGSAPVNGWTLVAVTGYSETGPFSLDISANLATQVAAMNHQQFSPMTTTGDFNGDGLIDIGHVEPTANHWHVALNSPSGYGPEQTWLSATMAAQTVSLVGDADADGRADLMLWNASTGQWQVARSTGAGFATPATWHAGFGAGQTPLLGDFNGDQLLDAGTAEKSSGTWTVALSSGTGFGTATTWRSSFGTNHVPVTGDFNGDGLTDIAAADGGSVQVALSDGRAFVPQPSPWLTGFGADQLSGADVNGDGLTDVLYYDRAAGIVKWARSTGRAFTAHAPLMDDHPFGLRGPDDILQVGDFGGHGQSGVGVFNPTTGQAELAYALGTPPDLLTRLDNGVGGTTSLRYEPSTRFGQTFLPFVTPLVTETTLSDGMGHAYATRYRYTRGLYDATSREFWGFGRVEAVDPEGNVAATEFLQDPHKKGRPALSELRDAAGRLWTQSAQTWACAEPQAGVHFVKLTQTNQRVYDGDASLRETQTRLAYDDATGNVTRTDEDGEPAVTGDERSTLTSYVANTSPTVWILGAPSQVQTLSGATVLAQRRFSYDGAAWGTAPTKSRLTKEEEWLNGATPRWLATALAYDALGNVKTVTDALGRVTTNTYDASGTFLTQIANALGHTRSLAYDARFGAVSGSTDPNGQTTTTEYDALGRATKTIGPTDTASQPTTRASYDLSSVPTKTTVCARVQSGQAKELCTDSYADGLGRTVQVRSQAEDPAKQLVTGTVEFDARGQVARQWVPYLDAASAAYVAPPTASLAAPAIYMYDPLGRVIETTDPDGSKTLVDYNDAETTTTLANGTQTEQTVDAYGRLVQVAEVVSEAERHLTAYAYDALGNLTQVTDAAGNLTRISYDSLGRKTSMDDPDMGRWTYAYDDVDNLKTQTDARNVVLTFTYDALNRLTGKTYAIPANSGIADPGAVTYRFDEPNAAAPYTTGRLTSIADGSGGSAFEYDRLGRLSRESKTLDGSTYVIRRGYDLLGRLTSLTYPDGDVATYAFNDQGGIETVTLTSSTGTQPIVTDIAYNAAGQLTKITYGNGTSTDHSYDPQTLRLSSLRTSNSELQTLQDFSYAFDPVGNVTGITDRVYTASQTFQYDALNRLTQAVGSDGAQTYAYDAIGNLTEKEGQRFNYGLTGGAKPHAVTAATNVELPASNFELGYDANGNLIQKGSSVSALLAQLLSYDAENRLAEVKSGQEETVSVTLQPGWNFFSLPVIPDDGAVAMLLPSFAQDFEQIARFEPATNSFTQHVGNSKFDEFDRLDYGVGYQIYVKGSNPVTVSFTGKTPSQGLSKSVAAGWDLLPASSLQATATGTVYGSIAPSQVLRYDTASRSLTAATQVAPGAGYYVQLGAAKTWTPPLPKDPTTRFVYDGDGGRVKLTTAAGTTRFLGQAYEIGPSGSTTKYVFAGSQRLAAIETPAGSAALPAAAPPASRLARCWRGAQQAVAWLVVWPEAEAALPPGQLAFYHPDHLGSVHLVTDGAGAVVARTEHRPFGQASRHDVSPALAARPSPPGFTGQRHDASTGLAFYHARYYDPALGRFTQPDPFVQDPADPQTLNRYAYVRNNPVNLVDPSGHFIEWILLGIGLAFVGSAAVSVGASTLSLLASATGHERTAQRTAKLAVAAGQVTYWLGMGISVGSGGELAAAGVLGAGVLAYAYLAQGVAQSMADDGPNLPFSASFSRQAANTALEQVPGVNQFFGVYLAIRGVNPLTQQALSPWQRMAVGGLSLAGLQRFAKARSAARWLGSPDKPSSESLFAPKKPSWNLGSHKSATKWQNQMAKRGWTPQQIDEAMTGGQKFAATNKVKPANSATRYMHPQTGRSVVIDDVTGEVLHVGGDGFRY